MFPISLYSIEIKFTTLYNGFKKNDFIMNFMEFLRGGGENG